MYWFSLEVTSGSDREAVRNQCCWRSLSIMWNVLFHFVLTSWISAFCLTFIYSCFVFNFVLASSLLLKCSTRCLAVLTMSWSVCPARQTEAHPCVSSSSCIAATILEPPSWTTALTGKTLQGKPLLHDWSTHQQSVWGNCWCPWGSPLP